MCSLEENSAKIYCDLNVKKTISLINVAQAFADHIKYVHNFVSGQGVNGWKFDPAVKHRSARNENTPFGKSEIMFLKLSDI